MMRRRHRLRRRSDAHAPSSAAWTPASLSGLLLWLRADLGISTSSGKVSGWADQSGNGYDFGQSTISLRPAYNATSANANGRPTAGYDGSDDVLECLGVELPPDLTVIKFQTGTGTGDRMLFNHFDGATFFTNLNSGAPSYCNAYRIDLPIDLDGFNLDADWSNFGNTMKMVEFAYASHADRAVSVNGTPLSATNAFTGTIVDPATADIFVGASSTALPLYASGEELAEMIVLDHRITAPESALLLAYGARYAI